MLFFKVTLIILQNSPLLKNICSRTNQVWNLLILASTAFVQTFYSLFKMYIDVFRLFLLKLISLFDVKNDVLNAVYIICLNCFDMYGTLFFKSYLKILFAIITSGSQCHLWFAATCFQSILLCSGSCQRPPLHCLYWWFFTWR